MRVDFNTKKLAKKVKYSGSAFVRKVVLDGMRQLIRQSPVDTGRFKANWNASISDISEGTTESTKSNFSKQSEGISAYKLGQTIFLHNNLQYAIPLEYGTSEQAPKGWIRNTANTMQKKFNEIRGLL